MAKRNVGDPQNRERILEAAISHFLQRGYTGTSLSSIAAAVGVSTPALYWHFKSKEEIYFTAMEQFLQGFLDSVSKAYGSPDPVRRLADIVEAHVTWQLEQRDIAAAYISSVGMRALVKDVPEQHRENLIQMQRQYTQMIRKTLTEGVQQRSFVVSDEGVASFTIITMCEYVHTWYNPEGRLPPEKLVRQIVEMALRSVGTADSTIHQVLEY